LKGWQPDWGSSFAEEELRIKMAESNYVNPLLKQFSSEGDGLITFSQPIKIITFDNLVR